MQPACPELCDPTVLLPVQLPIEDLCSLSSRSLQPPFTATVPASTEDVLLKGFQMLTMENDRIETAQQVHLLASLNSSFLSKQKSYVPKDARSYRTVTFCCSFSPGLLNYKQRWTRMKM